MGLNRTVDNLEVESVARLRTMLTRGAPLQGARLQDLDLTELEPQLLQRNDFHGVVVLGGRASKRLQDHLRLGGALLFPADDQTPFDAWRAHLYRPRELYAGLDAGYDATPDARTFAWARDPVDDPDVYRCLLRAIHDESVHDALAEFVAGRTVVGVMGGHAAERGGQDYRDAAHLGHQLAASGALVTTGGGPGAMEAANLGALAPDDTMLDAALDRLAAVPSFRPSVTDWARLAMRVRQDLTRAPGRLAGRPGSLGIPTWFYGHEPPNVFVDRVAKFFSNALREDLLLRVCRGGIVVLPGAAGTVQEIFQIATPMYYATGERDLPPLVLVGVDHWTRHTPVWPVLTALGHGHPMAAAIHLVDDVDAACQVIGYKGSARTHGIGTADGVALHGDLG